MDSQMAIILVTGGSGFLGSRLLLQLLAAGHEVRTTVRESAREEEVREMLRVGEAQSVEKLTFYVADLTKDEGWNEAVQGCEYVIHTASPFPVREPDDENDLIVPARDGSLRVLRAARDAGVKRVVLTSGFGAIGYSRTKLDKPFTEEEWTDAEKPNAPFVRSKTLAERAAWSFIEKEGGNLELSVINPAGIFGPVLSSKLSTSASIIKTFLDGDSPGMPDFYFGIVDVRDLADLHIRAMTDPNASGERFIAVAGPKALAMADVASILRNRLGKAAQRVPTKKLSNWQVKIAALVDPRARQMSPHLGKQRNASNEKSCKVLGWSPRPEEESIVATAESMIRLGIVKDAA